MLIDRLNSDFIKSICSLKVFQEFDRYSFNIFNKIKYVINFPLRLNVLLIKKIVEIVTVISYLPFHSAKVTN